ncbi:hypothetical protein HDV57DRAFT_347337 [Trichoderma longibrachiatum]|uniref:Uncharacterized protein n=1 Tax=Trichoderma longibrachiatum ATCC 18648 TaxID=983965 RepID=A0A2T4BXU9_TRILO|nr:hypothetical protein M440DRAFT_109332 [Trichoderma longibrachiatum ATCC 18648]
MRMSALCPGGWVTTGGMTILKRMQTQAPHAARSSAPSNDRSNERHRRQPAGLLPERGGKSDKIQSGGWEFFPGIAAADPASGGLPPPRGCGRRGHCSARSFVSADHRSRHSFQPVGCRNHILHVDNSVTFGKTLSPLTTADRPRSAVHWLLIQVSQLSSRAPSCHTAASIF